MNRPVQRSTSGAQRSVWDDVLPRAASLLAPFLASRRWFGGKGRRMTRARLIDHARLRGAEHALLAIAEARYADQGGELERYFAPLAATYGERSGASPPLLRYGGVTIHDAFEDEGFCRALLKAIARGAQVGTARGGAFAFAASAAPRRHPIDPRTVGVRLVAAEQSNTSVVYDDALIFKAYRRPGLGPNPEIELLRFLAERTDFDHAPALAGWAEYRAPDRASMAIGVLQAFVPNEGDGWSYTLRELGALLEQGRDPEASADATADEGRLAARARPYLAELADLGRVTAGLHLALASGSAVPELAPRPIDHADVEAWRASVSARLTAALSRLRDHPHTQDRPIEALKRSVLAGEARLRAIVGGLDGLLEGGPGRVIKTRHHGDYHLGQVLKAGPRRWVVIDFEGEPLRPLAERRAHHTPLKDVAGMLRSFDYARHAVTRGMGDGGWGMGGASGDTNPPSPSPIPRLAAWERLARRAFLDAYLGRARVGGARFLPRSDDALRRVLATLELEKALYELEYELDNRPDWLTIPLAALAAVARP